MESSSSQAKNKFSMEFKVSKEIECSKFPLMIKRQEKSQSLII